MDISKLAVITIISNPVRYASRYKLYRRFSTVMTQAKANLITVEMAFGDRPFEITDEGNPNHLQIRSIDELWHKENMINLGIQHAVRMNPKIQYFAWVDADVLPMQPVGEWLEETIHELQHYHVVQMFETAIDLDPNNKMLGGPATSFMAQYIKSGCVPPVRGGFWVDHYDTIHGHPGYAWACTREALDCMGGHIGGPLIDFAILGAGDRHMALGLVGCMEQSFEHLNPAYRHALMQWQVRSERWIKRDVGFVKGSIFHFWHGKKKDRKYTERWKILYDNLFDPILDLSRDAQGLLKLETWDARQIKLRDQIRAYTRQRNEDSVDV